MSDQTEPSIPPNLRPQPTDVAYDLDRALDAVVSLRTRIPQDAFTPIFPVNAAQRGDA